MGQFTLALLSAFLLLLLFPVAEAADADADDGLTSPSSSLRSLKLKDSMNLHTMLSRAADLSRQGRELVAGNDLSTDRHSQKEDAMNRRLGSCSDKLDKCKSNLKTCEKEAAQPTFLFTQMADMCKLKRKTDSKGERYYEWSSKDMDDDTYLFSDRPYRIAETMTTEDFFDEFDNMFTKDNGGKPNGAITFRHKNTDKFEGPLISVFVEAAYKTDGGKFVYKLRQSNDQETVNALDDFFGSNKDDHGDVAEYFMCSLFIDSPIFGPECYG